jgi:hypothetical protein
LEARVRFRNMESAEEETQSSKRVAMMVGDVMLGKCELCIVDERNWRTRLTCESDATDGRDNGLSDWTGFNH